MKRIASVFVLALVASGCASTTVIRSNPSNAKVYDQSGTYVGRTPYTHTDYAIVGHKEIFTVRHDEHEPATVEATRDNVNVPNAVLFGIGGIFVVPVWAGLLWSFDYRPAYTVELDHDSAKSKVARAK